MAVVGIRDGVELAPPGEPYPEVVKELERLLEMARSGELTGVAVVLHWRDECTSDQQAGMLSRSMLGGLEILKSRIVDSLRARE